MNRHAPHDELCGCFYITLAEGVQPRFLGHLVRIGGESRFWRGPKPHLHRNGQGANGQDFIGAEGFDGRFRHRHNGDRFPQCIEDFQYAAAWSAMRMIGEIDDGGYITGTQTIRGNIFLHCNSVE
jgi:hypothetical protein